MAAASPSLRTLQTSASRLIPARLVRSTELGVEVREHTAGRRVIGYDDTARAMMIVDRAGIDITSKAIWRDRADLRAVSEDPEFRKWLRQRERA